MILLSRTVRFSVNDAAASLHATTPTPTDNTFAAFPSMLGIGRHYELDIRCRGEISPDTGYFLNIKEIDRAVRATAIPAIARDAHREPGNFYGTLRDALPALNKELAGSIASVRWHLSPYHSIEMSPPSSSKTENIPTDTVALLRHQFEFAAAHRLHIPSISDEANRELFGKCNNVRGHGHNYRVEPCVEVRVAAHGGEIPAFTLGDLERITSEQVVQRFDHTHLNEDTAEFGSGPGGLNPSVENIVRICFDLLAPAIAAAGATLRSVTVWETDKTSCTYPAGPSNPL